MSVKTNNGWFYKGAHYMYDPEQLPSDDVMDRHLRNISSGKVMRVSDDCNNIAFKDLPSENGLCSFNSNQLIGGELSIDERVDKLLKSHDTKCTSCNQCNECGEDYRLLFILGVIMFVVVLAAFAVAL